MKIGRLLADDPRCINFVEMLKEYGLKANRRALETFLMDCEPIEDRTPKAINDRREYYRTVYLKTDHWKHLKKRQLGMVTACEFCKVTSNLDVHHRHYRNLYDVKGRDLAVLCRKCHEELHSAVDSRLRGQEKEDALENIFVTRLPFPPPEAPPPKVRAPKVIVPASPERVKFHDLLKRMISVASKIRKANGMVLAGRIRPLFRPMLASENRKLQRFFLQSS